MTASACGSCGSAVQDATICTGCTRDLAELLLLAASISTDLDDAVAKLLKRGGGGRSSETSAPLPVDLAASEAKHQLSIKLGVAVRAIQLPPGADGYATDWTWNTIGHMAKWLAARLDRIRQHEHAALLHDGIRRAVNVALAVIDPETPDRVPAGPCPWCTRQLFAELGEDQVTCLCGQTVVNLIADRMNRVMQAEVLGTPATVSAALAVIGISVPRGTITSWVSRGRIALRPGGVVAMSEVLAMKAQSTARVRG